MNIVSHYSSTLQWMTQGVAIYFTRECLTHIVSIMFARGMATHDHQQIRFRPCLYKIFCILHNISLDTFLTTVIPCKITYQETWNNISTFYQLVLILKYHKTPCEPFWTMLSDADKWHKTIESLFSSCMKITLVFEGSKYTYTLNDIMVHWAIYVLNAVMIIYNLTIYIS